jgi:hypothetical protein
MKYEYNEFPKWVYHKKEDAKIIKTEKELKALSKDWFNSPLLKNVKRKEFKEATKTAYKPVQFPKWVYDKDKNSKLVKDESEYKALDKKWIVEKKKKEVKKDNPPQIKVDAVIKEAVIIETDIEDNVKAEEKKDVNPFNK